MIRTGYNHSVPIDGKVLHVQTEHHESAGACYIETEVFLDGRVLFSRRLERSGPAVTPDERRGLDGDLRRIHKVVIAKLIAGELALGEQVPDANKISSAPQMAKVRPVRSPMQDRQLRRVLLRFVHAVGSDEPSNVEELTRRIRSATTAMAVIMGSFSVSFMRRDDVAELVMHRSEAVGFLSRGGGPDFEEGLPLWRSFAHLSRSFRQINERRGLIRLDHESLEKIRTHLHLYTQEDGTLGKMMLDQLDSCAGRDPALDALLAEAGEGLTAEKLRPELDRLIESLEAKLAALPEQDESVKESELLAVIA